MIMSMYTWKWSWACLPENDHEHAQENEHEHAQENDHEHAQENDHEHVYLKMIMSMHRNDDEHVPENYQRTWTSIDEHRQIYEH